MSDSTTLNIEKVLWEAKVLIHCETHVLHTVYVIKNGVIYNLKMMIDINKIPTYLSKGGVLYM